MRRIVRQFTFALSFLTVFPVSGKIRFDLSDSGRSTSFFPIIGLLIGLAGMLLGVPRFFNPFTRAVMVCVFFLFITRGIHADGLLDTFDGFFSMKYGPEKIKKIMKDPGVGAMGFVGGFSFYILKIAGLFEVLKLDFPDYLLIALIPAISRGGISFICLLSRKYMLSRGKDDKSVIGEGLGREFILSSGILQFLTSSFITLLFSIGFYLISGVLTIIALPFLNIGFWMGWYLICKNRLGIVNGDTMGAGIEISEVFLLFAGYVMMVL